MTKSRINVSPALLCHYLGLGLRVFAVCIVVVPWRFLIQSPCWVVPAAVSFAVAAYIAVLRIRLMRTRIFYRMYGPASIINLWVRPIVQFAAGFGDFDRDDLDNLRIDVLEWLFYTKPALRVFRLEVWKSGQRYLIIPELRVAHLSALVAAREGDS
jgi:hypothetical protein